jgi:hypothetical protein
MSTKLIAQETERLNKMSDRQLIAYHALLWDSNQSGAADRARTARHLKIVEELLTSRGLVKVTA